MDIKTNPLDEEIKRLTDEQREKLPERSDIFQCPPSTTGNMTLLKAEAKLAAQGQELSNPHIPLDTETLEQLREWCDKNDIQPAWEQ